MSSQERNVRRPSRPIRGWVQSAGAKLRYERVGNGLPVVFVHPVAMDRRIWDRQVADFARHYEVIRYDLRGFGRSSAGPRTTRHADDLARLLAALDLQRVALVGLEEGAEIALELAADNPGKVGALVLASPVVRELLTRVVRSEPAISPYELLPPRTRDEQRVNRKAAWRWILIRLQNQTRELSRLWSRSGRHRYLAPWWADESVAGRLSEIAAPTLLVHAEWTHDWRRTGDAYLQAAIPDCTVVMVPRTKMLMVLEASETFNRMVLEFLEAHYHTVSSDSKPGP